MVSHCSLSTTHGIFSKLSFFFFFGQYMEKKIEETNVLFVIPQTIFQGLFLFWYNYCVHPFNRKEMQGLLTAGSLQPLLFVCQMMSLCFYSLPDVHLTRALSRELPSLIILDKSVKCRCSTLLETYWFDSVPVGYSLNPRLLSQTNLGF